MIRKISKRPKVYIFGWPSLVGGADTKLHHLLILLHDLCEFTLVPTFAGQLRQKFWTQFMDSLGIKYCSFEELPRRMEGIAFGLCNPYFFTGRIAELAKEKGLKVVWSCEMMWHFEGERSAIKNGLVDRILYVSEFQRAALIDGAGNLPSTITGNYIDPAEFPFSIRDIRKLVIGRLSRPDPDKFPEDFPAFYESLELSNVRFRVMAWSKELAAKYRWHHFDNRWDLLRANQEPPFEFLQSLDLFVYPLGHRFRESWGRSTVEAMLTGCIPLVPRGHFFESLIVHEKTGFICGDFLEYQSYSRALENDLPMRLEMMEFCQKHAREVLCDREKHRKLWLDVFTSV